jgi:tetratricopeptide (TPR) repeat protein
MSYRNSPARVGRALDLILMLAAWALLGVATAAQTVDPLIEGRASYNRGDWAAAIGAATAALQLPDRRSEALLLIGRATLEKFRETGEPSELAQARDALRSVNPGQLSTRARAELMLGLGEALYLDAEYRAAAELFDAALGDGANLAARDRDQVLDWWATALDRFAQTRAGDERSPIYAAISERMSAELRRAPGSSTASYWRAAAALARSEVDLAWDLAVAGWVQASLAQPPQASGLRADLDRLVVNGIIPQRLDRLANVSDVDAARTGMLAEWEMTKQKWTK